MLGLAVLGGGLYALLGPKKVAPPPVVQNAASAPAVVAAASAPPVVAPPPVVEPAAAQPFDAVRDFQRVVIAQSADFLSLIHI